MHTSTRSETSLFGLVRELREEIKTFVKQEVQLAKAELSEKMACFGRNATFLGVGGFIAYAGLIILLAGLGSLLAYAFENAGMERSMANFLGLGIVGLVVAGAGAALIFKALQAFKGASFAPEKALQTLKEIKPGETTPETQKIAPETKASSDELQSRVDVTLTRMEETTEELRDRLTPRHMRQTMVRQIRTHPVVSGLVGAGTGLISFFLIRRRIRHARA